MSSNVKLNRPAFTAFRQSPHVIGAVNAEAERVAARANALGHNSHGGKPHWANIIPCGSGYWRNAV